MSVAAACLARKGEAAPGIQRAIDLAPRHTGLRLTAAPGHAPVAQPLPPTAAPTPPPQRRNRRAVTVRLEIDRDRKLRQIAAARGTTLQDLLHGAVERWLSAPAD